MFSTMKLSGLTICLTAMALAPVVQAASTIELNYASVYGVNSTIIVDRLPIEISAGKFVYKDLTINLIADAKGNITVTPAIPKQAPSPPPITGGLIAGRYLSQDGTNGFTLQGPFPVAGTSVSEWTLTTTKSVANTRMTPATIYVGPLNQSPVGARVRTAKITDKEYNFGTVNADASDKNDLIGVSQLGNQVEIADFTFNGDKSTPVTTTVYALVK